MNQIDLGDAYKLLHDHLTDRRRTKQVRLAWAAIQTQIQPELAAKMNQLLTQLARNTEVLESVASYVVADQKRRAERRRQRQQSPPSITGSASAGGGGEQG